MKYSLNLLTMFVPELQKISSTKLKEILTLHLAEVEEVYNWADSLRDVIVTKVLDISSHPRSAKLQVVKVTDGTKNYTIVTAAQNFKVGDYLPLTPIGKRVPVNMYPDKFDGIIKEREFLGIRSEGMLNSGAELGVDSDHSGLFILNEIVDDAFLGRSLASIPIFDDSIIVIENKALTHRGDVFSHVGLAREIGAILGFPLKEEKILDVIDRYFTRLTAGWRFVEDFQDGFTIKGGKFQDVYTYYLVGVEDADNTFSMHSALEDRLLLTKLGIGVKNRIIDFTNIVTVLLGQPIHGFDYTKIKNISHNRELVFGVEKKKISNFKGIDNKEYSSQKEVLMITLNDYPVAIAGVLGGKSTEIDDTTNKVILEIATFDNITVRQGRMRLGIFTLASDIFARPQDPFKPDYFIEKYLKTKSLIKFIDSEIRDKLLQRKIRLRKQYIQEVTGDKNIYTEDAISLLKMLGFKKLRETNDLLIIDQVPTWRLDINIPEDILEELVRLKGYSHIKPRLPHAPYRYSVWKSDGKMRLQLSSFLAAIGGIEHVGLSFMSDSEREIWQLPLKYVYRIKNAKSQEVSIMRPFLVPSMLKLEKMNLDKQDPMFFFEIDKTFLKTTSGKEEHMHLGVVISAKGQEWMHLAAQLEWVLFKTLEFLKITGHVTEGGRFVVTKNAGVELLGSEKWQSIYEHLNPNARAQIIFNLKDGYYIVGVVGLLSAKMQSEVGISPRNRVIGVMELDITQFSSQVSVGENWHKFGFKGGVYGGPIEIRDYAFILSVDNVDRFKIRLRKFFSNQSVKTQVLRWEVFDIFLKGKTVTITLRIRYRGNVSVNNIVEIEKLLQTELEELATLKDLSDNRAG